MTTYIDNIVSRVQTDLNIKDQRLAQFYALLILVKGSNIALEDVHDAWAMNMNFKPTTNYCYGHEHQSIVPFDKLSKETQNKDASFVAKLNKIAKFMGK